MKRVAGPSAFPSSPRRPPKHVVRFQKSYALTINNFLDVDTAKAFIDLVIRDDEITWQNDNCFTCTILDLTVSSATLSDIMEGEGDITLCEPYPFLASTIRGAAFQQRVTREQASNIDAEAPSDDETSHPSSKRAKASQKRSDAPVRSTRTPVDGHTSIADIAQQLQMEPSKARALLRKLGIEKPAEGWQWADPAPIIAKLRGAK